jgi:hypothetical protein
VTTNGIVGPNSYANFANLLYSMRMKASPKPTISVITFNYDIGIDMALYKRGFIYDYGIQIQDTEEDCIPLLKLHGSLNWATKSDTKEVIPLLLQDYLSHYNESATKPNVKCNISIGTELKEYYKHHSGINVESEPAIVPPAFNKSDQQQALSNVWSNAAKHLSEAEQIFIIGYSLPETDAFFRLLYALGTVGKNPLTRIVVYNPEETGEVDKRFQKMLGSGARDRYQYKKIKFSDAIIDIEGMFIP